MVAYLALLIGVLVAAWRPVMAMEAAGAERTTRFEGAPQVAVSTLVAVAPWNAATLEAPSALVALETRGHRSHWVLERVPLDRRHPSWHRGVSRRLPRGIGGQLSLPSDSGSIPTPFLLYTQRLEWHVLPLPLVHGVGGRSAPPRAPPR